MTPQEQSIWTSYFNKVIDFLDDTDLSKLTDEDALQKAFCEYMNAKYKETIREVEIPALKQIEGLGKEYWEIDESTKYNEHEYIPCELKFHGLKQEDRDFASEVNADSEELHTIVRQFSDVHVAMSMFITINENDFDNCKEIGEVECYTKKQGKNTFYIRIAYFAKSEYNGNYLRRFSIENYKYYYDKKKHNQSLFTNLKF